MMKTSILKDRILQTLAQTPGKRISFQTRDFFLLKRLFFVGIDEKWSMKN